MKRRTQGAAERQLRTRTHRSGALRVGGDRRFDGGGLFRAGERWREDELAGAPREIALIDEGEECVLEDGLAHGLGALDLPAEEHLLPDPQRARGEILLGERGLFEDADGARGDAVALDEAPNHGSVEGDPAAAVEPVVARAEADVLVRAAASVVDGELARPNHLGDCLGEVLLEARSGSEHELLLEEARERLHALGELGARERRARRREERHGDERAIDEEVDNDVLGDVEDDALLVGHGVDDVVAGVDPGAPLGGAGQGVARDVLADEAGAHVDDRGVADGALAELGA